MDSLETALFATMYADLEPPQVVGATPEGMRLIYYVKGGAVEGPNVRGKVLPGGGDWLRLRADGVGVLDVRATMEADDGSLIYAHYPGYIVAAPEVMASLQSGDEVDVSEYYFRTTPVFETASEKYAFLNHTVFVSIGRLSPLRVAYTIYRVL